ncbi:hypothetical protein EVAR_32607_1 [Eumeta japonica]|uniref:Reverse transcriptase domain-containing protein n=1 Tax=Eumeta variegata TaxID=151549 RepID=A0A4C1WIN2_EUMVA|nr:hypothetical protein EVAR_32607_1 [Eumeta japonica]
MDELSVKCLLYADDREFLASSASGLEETVNQMNESVKKRGVKVNVGKTNVMVFERGVSMTEGDIFREEIAYALEYLHRLDDSKFVTASVGQPKASHTLANVTMEIVAEARESCYSDESSC